MTKPNRNQVIKLLTAQEVYDAMDLEMFFDEEKQKYPTLEDILFELGIHDQEIEYVNKFNLSELKG